MPKKIEEKRSEATQRQAAYDNLTPTQKLKRLDEGAYKATRQREKLRRQIKE